jgi:hypothetical protein
MAVAQSGRKAGVTVAEVNLKLIWDVITAIKMGKTGYAYVVDDKGRLIAHPDMSRVLRNTDMSGLPQVTAARGVTTVQFPGPIQSLESDGFTTKPNDEAGDFYISPGVNWFSVRALKPAAVQNLGVVIYGRVYEIVFQTVAVNDLAVIFHFPARRAQTARAWAPPLKP